MSHRRDLRLLSETRPFARPRHLTSWWQLTSTLALFAVTLVVAGWATSPWIIVAVVPVAAGCLLRAFVLLHDCAHHSLFRSARLNDLVGPIIAAITGIAYRAWRADHLWHHRQQGKLGYRGVDMAASPITVAEARADPKKALRWSRLVNVVTVCVGGAVGMIVERKFPFGYFLFRKSFRWRVRNRSQLLRSVWLTDLAHLGLHALIWVAFGWRVNLMVITALFFAGAAGAVLLWVQHNAERAYYADDESWSFVEVALRGSTNVWLSGVWRWCTADIGVHHAHHLNPRIPNYRLREAHAAIAELQAVAPMTWTDFARSFDCLFWDPDRGRMVTYADVFAGGEVEATSPRDVLQ